MKIEKISEDKIRIILNQEDFKDKSINIQELLLITPDSQKLFLELLNKIKEKFDFDVTGYKLLIETFFEDNDNYIFIITKYSKIKKQLKIQQKFIVNASQSSIYQFNNFDDFCALCSFLSQKNIIQNTFNSAILYYYNNNYYLIIKNTNSENENTHIFNAYISEFSNIKEFSKTFEIKLKEYGKVILKNNAITTGIRYLSYK